MNMYGYPSPVDHLNIEIQKKNHAGKYVKKWDYHVILDKIGQVKECSETGVWKGRKG